MQNIECALIFKVIIEHVFSFALQPCISDVLYKHLYIFNNKTTFQKVP